MSDIGGENGGREVGVGRRLTGIWWGIHQLWLAVYVVIVVLLTLALTLTLDLKLTLTVCLIYSQIGTHYNGNFTRFEPVTHFYSNHDVTS